MSNPFKKITSNSIKSKKEWATVKTSSTTKSRICDSCGAPRPRKTDIRVCNYCGFSFMDLDNELIITH